MTPEFWHGFLAGGLFASVITLTTASVRALWSRKQKHS